MFPEAIHSTAIKNYNKTQNYGYPVNCSFDLFECGYFTLQTIVHGSLRVDATDGRTSAIYTIYSNPL